MDRNEAEALKSPQKHPVFSSELTEFPREIKDDLGNSEDDEKGGRVYFLLE